MDIEVGDIIEDKYGSIRIMAIIEGYVMARRPRCYPFLKPVKKFLEPEYWHPTKTSQNNATRMHIKANGGVLQLN